MNIKKIISVALLGFLYSCGGGGGDSTPEPTPAPEPLSITFNDKSVTTPEDTEISSSLDITLSRTASLTYTTLSPPSYGNVSFFGKNFTYTPNENFYGSDSFTVRVSSEGVSAEGTVEIDVTSVNDLPEVNLSLVGFSASESPLIITDSFIEVSLNYSDVENSKDNLIVRAKYNGEDIELDLSSETIPFDPFNGNLSGPKILYVEIDDGDAVVSQEVSFWAAKKFNHSVNDDLVYTLVGDTENLERGFRYVLFLDALPDVDVRNAGREALRFYFSDFVGNSNEYLLETINNVFNAVVIEAPLGESTLGVETGFTNENCLGEDVDPNIYCIFDIAQLAYDYAASFFGESYFDNYSVITGINGRGVNSGNINVQPLSDSRDGVDVNSYRRGPNYLVNVLKHEFGHGYSFLDDHYFSDYESYGPDDDRWPTYWLYGESSPDTTYVQDPQNVKWKHKFKSETIIAGKDDLSDTSMEGVGIWDGCYHHTEECQRPTSNSIMKGDGRSSWLEYASRSTGTEFDPIGVEAFELRSLLEQGLHELEIEITASSVNASTNFVIDPDVYELRWYVDRQLVEDMTNTTSITVNRSSGYTEIAYRVVDIRENPIVTVNDDLNNFADVYYGAYSKFNHRYYYCDIKPGSWEGITETACVPTFEAEYNDGRMFSTPSIAQSNDDLKAYGGFMRWWEYSGLGAQFVINWEYY